MRFDEFKLDPIVEALLTEVSMAPSALQQWAESPAAQGVVMGFEFEVIVPNATSGYSHQEVEPDRRIAEDNGVDDIVNFFGPGLSNRDSDIIREKIHDDYREWEEIGLGDYLDEHSNQIDNIIYILLKNNAFDECLAQAAKELEVDPNWNWYNKEVVARADELCEKQVHQLTLGRNSREWEDAYDIAVERMRDDFYNEDHTDEWLVYRGIRFMSDARSEFSLEWPGVSDDWGDGVDDQANLEEVAAAFKSGTGFTNVQTNSEYHGVSDRSSGWIIEPDASLEADPHDTGLEFVSPALPMAKALAALNRFKSWAKDYGCYTGLKHETGLHINISIPNFDIANLDYIKLALFMGDQYVLDQFGRFGNSYAESAINVIRRRAKEEPQSVVQMFNKMQEHLSTAASKLVHSGSTKKNTSINTKDGYVEFRGPGGDYLNMETEKITNTAIRMAMALQIACDENAYKQEYGKKLFKLLGPENENEDNTVTLFTKYVNGEINKDALKSSLKQKQTARNVSLLPARTRKIYKVWLTSSPMVNITITARTDDDAITRAQIQKPEWDRYRNDAFTVKVIGEAPPPAGTPMAATAGQAQPVGRAMSQDEIAAAARASHNAHQQQVAAA